MYYEINVSLNGQHFFATAERSAWTEEKARKLYDTFKKKFPEKDGYKITVTMYSSCGKTIEF